MGFVVTILTFIVIGIIACICTCVCCNKEPSANLFPLTLANTATICCWMMWAIVYLAHLNPLISFTTPSVDTAEKLFPPFAISREGFEAITAYDSPTN
ncbi:putative ATPase, V0 complex, subunit e1/e2 [Helianthus anomalus]